MSMSAWRAIAKVSRACSVSSGGAEARTNAQTSRTAVIDATRALLLGGPVAGDLVASLAWSVGILAVFGPLGVHTYRRATTR